MSEPERHIIALSGGGFSGMPPSPILDEYVLSIARATRATERPRVCFLPTASGDSPTYIMSFFEAFATKAEASVLRLFALTGTPIDELLLGQDVIYVGGGNTANMLAIWRLHGVDEVIREAWRRGIVMAGVSAGSMYWFECGVTDSFGPDLAALHDGLGVLAGSYCPHYDGEERRRPTYRRLVAEGLAAGLAADDEAAVHFVGTDIAEVVASSPAAHAYRVEVIDGVVRETALPARLLGA